MRTNQGSISTGVDGLAQIIWHFFNSKLNGLGSPDCPAKAYRNPQGQPAGTQHQRKAPKG